MESQLPQFLLISPRFDLHNGMIAKDDSYHLVTQIIDIRGFFYYNTLVNFSPLVLNVVWCYAKKIDCIFNILSISFYLDQNKFWYISGCLALSKNNFSNFNILIVLIFLNQKPITAWYQVNLCPWMVLLKNNNCIFYIISIFQ